MSPDKHSGYCRKESEIAEIHTKVNQIEKVVMGKDGLVVTVPLLKQSIDALNLTMVGLERGMKGFLKYQMTMEGKNDGKTEMKKRSRWIIGLLAGLIGVLLAGLIVTIRQLAQTGV